MKLRNLIIMAAISIAIMLPIGFAWADSNFQYRKPITITETSGSSLTDYQVKITVDTASLISAGKMNSDCSDIRFYDSDDITALSYWIEDGTCNTANTIIWVKVPSIPASSSKTIHMYYGNPLATSQSSIDNTFIFGDDFNGASIDTNKWSATSGVSVSNGYVEIQGNNAWGSRYIKSIQTFDRSTQGYSIEYKTKVSTMGTKFMTGYGSSTTGEVFFYFDGNNDIARYVDGNYKDFGTAYTANEWHRVITAIKKGSGFKFTYDGQVKEDGTTNTDNNYPVYFNLYNNYAYIDWVIVRKYASSEPTITLGAEEMNTAISITSISITPSTLYTKTDATCDATFSDVADSASLYWYVNDVNKTTYAQTCTSCSSMSGTLPSSEFAKNDVVKCEVTATKGTTSDTKNVQTTVANSLPTAPTDIVWNTPVINRNVTATASGSTDIDGDSITYYYKFFDVNSSSILQDYSTNNTFLVPDSMLGHVLRVYAKAYDGANYSSEYFEEATVTNISVVISSPANTTYLTDTIDLNYTVADTTAFNCTVYLDGQNVDMSSSDTYSKAYKIESPGQHNFRVACTDAEGNSFDDIVYFTMRFDIKVELFDEQTGASLGGLARIHNSTYVDEKDVTYYGIYDKANTSCEKSSAGSSCSFTSSYISAYSYDGTWTIAEANVSDFTYGRFSLHFDSVNNVNYGRAEVYLETGYGEIKIFDVWNDISSSDATKFEVIYLNGFCYVYMNNTYKADYSTNCKNPAVRFKVSSSTTSQATVLYITDPVFGGKSTTWHDVMGNKWIDGYSDILYAGTFHLKYPMRGLYSTENIIDGKLYLLPEQYGVYSAIQLRDSDGNALRQRIITFYRVNPTGNLRVFEAKTDDSGRAIVFVDPNAVYAVEDYITKETKYVRFSSGETATIILGLSNWTSPPYWEYSEGIEYSCSTGNTSVSCSFNDKTNRVNYFELLVSENGTQTCYNKSLTNAGYLECSATGNWSTWSWSLKARIVDGETIHITGGSVFTGELNLGENTIWLALMINTALVMMMPFLPPVAIVLIPVAIAGESYLGILPREIGVVYFIIAAVLVLLRGDMK